MTPRPLADALVAALKPSGLVLEPCAGDGAFVEALRVFLQTDEGIHDVWTCDIADGDMGFEWWSQPVNWVITNPPWSQFARFLRKAMQIADDVAFLATVNHWWTKRRVRDVRDAGFGYKQLLLCDWPPEWSSSGFQLGMMHVQRGYRGPLDIRML
jgi:hypothetical protein